MACIQKYYVLKSLRLSVQLRTTAALTATNQPTLASVTWKPAQSSTSSLNSSVHTADPIMTAQGTLDPHMSSTDLGTTQQAEQYPHHKIRQ